MAEVKNAESTDSHRFELDDENWVSYLEENGYVVIKSIADPEQVSTAIDLFWQYFETAWPTVKRNDLESWKTWKTDKRGIVTNGGIIQCAGAWYVRALPKVKQAFQKIWKEDSLIVSMDSLLLWKPWWLHPEKPADWFPRTEGFHVDQNPFEKPGLHCVQGMVPLYDVEEMIGGLEVCPRSHLPENQEALRKSSPRFKGTGDFCMIPPKNPVIASCGRKLVTAKAGDLILWDSRTIHEGLVGEAPKTTELSNPLRLARLTQAVCMMPRSKASEEVLVSRREGFQQGFGFSHWANEAHVTGFAPDSYKPIELTPEQLELL